jgi:hypothetical protein
MREDLENWRGNNVGVFGNTEKLSKNSYATEI